VNYSDEDVKQIARSAATTVALYGHSTSLEGMDQLLDHCVYQALNRFWDGELDISETVDFVLNGVTLAGRPGTVMTFETLEELAQVSNADTCTFVRKRANARNGSITRGGVVKLQGGMVINIVSTR
jgi:hypothetical protein